MKLYYSTPREKLSSILRDGIRETPILLEASYSPKHPEMMKKAYDILELDHQWVYDHGSFFRNGSTVRPIEMEIQLEIMGITERSARLRGPSLVVCQMTIPMMAISALYSQAHQMHIMGTTLVELLPNHVALFAYRIWMNDDVHTIKIDRVRK